MSGAQDEREERLKREAEEELRKAADEAADDEWSRLLEPKPAADVELPPDGWWGPEALGETPLGEDEDVEVFVEEEEGVGEDEGDGEGEGDVGDDADLEDDEIDAEEAAELQEVIKKINAGEFVPPRMPEFVRNLFKRKPAKPAPPQPQPEGAPGKAASLTLGALQALPNYTVSSQAPQQGEATDLAAPAGLLIYDGEDCHVWD